jgi:hypothetical protein
MIKNENFKTGLSVNGGSKDCRGYAKHKYTVKKGYRFSHSQPGKVWLMSLRVGTGKPQTFFLQCKIDVQQT